MSGRAWAAFAAVSLLWGVPYLFIKIAVDGDAHPMLIAWGRVLIGAAILLPIAWRIGALRGLRSRLRPLALFAACEMALPWWLIPVGEQHLSSSVTAILIASVPLMIAAIALRFDPGERVRGIRLAGLFVGLAGVVLLVGVDIAGRPGELFGAGAILLATLGYAIGPMIVKHRFAGFNPLGPVAAAFAISSVMLAPAALATLPSADPTAGALASIAVLGVACSALGMFLFVALITEAGPSRASVITYINPAVAVALGVTLLDESLAPAAVAGLLLILAGSWLSTDGRAPPGAAAAVTRLRRRGQRPRVAEGEIVGLGAPSPQRSRG
ncbi:MAG TPA: DMT family transporter [Solirubrobacterales bacterium]|nr:DMT family transporter [Solirubrobacterales bacterium]